MLCSRALGVGLLGVALSWLGVTAAGCSAPQRNVPPNDVYASAMVPGMPDARFWGDAVTPELDSWLRTGIDRERAHLRSQGVTALPDAVFLAVSGGGAEGAYGAGLLCGWSARGDRPTFRIVTGISTGALTAPFAFLGSEYDHVLREVYTSVSTKDLIRARGALAALTSEAMFDPAPLRAIIEKHVDEAFLARVAEEHRKGRGLIVGTTNMDAQRPVIWNMGAIAASGHPDALRLFRDVLMASAAIPAMFPPVMITVEAGGGRYEEMHSDGGVTSQVFLYPASLSVKDLSAAGGVQRRRVMYVLRNSRLAPTPQEVERRALPIAARAVSTLIKTQGVGDLYRIYLGATRDEIDFNLASIPDEFTMQRTEEFDREYMRALFDLGYARALDGYPWKKGPPGFEPPAPLALPEGASAEVP